MPLCFLLCLATSHNKHVMETHLPGQLPAKQLCSNLLHEDATALCDQDQAHHTQDHAAAMMQATPAAAPAPPPPRRVCLDWTEAAKSGDTLELRRLLRAHPSLLDHKVGGLEATATHWAAANGHADALQHLLEWGADVLVQTATGCLPLHSAAAAGREECMQLLLAARPGLQQHQLAALNEDGLTPAALAMHHRHRLVHGLLLAAHAGSGPEQQQEEQHQQQQEAMPAPQQQQQAGMRRGFLLGGGKQSSSTLQKQESPAVLPQGTDADDASLSSAGSPAQQQPRAPQHSSSPDLERPAPGQHACTEVQAVAVPAEEDAQQQGMVEQPPAAQAAAGAMQQQPAAIDRALGRRWLDAARAGDLQVLQALLLQAPQLLDYRGAGISYAFVGNSALHWAAAKGHTTAVAWLLRQGAAVAAANEAGASALHTAVEHGQPGCAEALVLLGGAEIQAADGYGQSVLSLAGTDSGSRGRGCVVRAEQLLLWGEARKLQQQEAGWGNVAMQRFLQLAGKAGEAARCLEKQELVALAAAELQRLVDRVAAL